ncbi:dinitrogenase iron-molybdenum cofactor biosynthesis protein [Arcobacter sp. CECT 8986]|uniref:NifB/NifX family molybdenum-iron cluster-binding protein n=1 Tax=Arcobacter sp. CECT 8986 TaxID=2044507 RepID=UPI001009EBF2|nr:NifB/NifX family molybdenum-iron cluster-binding protein [Arcobacter sp. CECT 8986]RXJ99671.1 dinitrogenase iron-molybdenum cofactor biosynthesis protein [Arcobacter sp. CECT 8986]
MKVAFASKDNIYVNEHFGWCKKFFIYEIKENSYNFIKEVESKEKIENELDKLSYKIQCLDNSDILYVEQIGPKASLLVKDSKIFPIKASNEKEKIEDVLNKLIKMQENPPIWMRRIISK